MNAQSTDPNLLLIAPGEEVATVCIADDDSEYTIYPSMNYIYYSIVLITMHYSFVHRDFI